MITHTHEDKVKYNGEKKDRKMNRQRKEKDSSYSQMNNKLLFGELIFKFPIALVKVQCFTNKTVSNLILFFSKIYFKMPILGYRRVALQKFRCTGGYTLTSLLLKLLYEPDASQGDHGSEGDPPHEGGQHLEVLRLGHVEEPEGPHYKDEDGESDPEIWVKNVL